MAPLPKTIFTARKDMLFLGWMFELWQPTETEGF
jgi:hypothetical protein